MPCTVINPNHILSNVSIFRSHLIPTYRVYTAFNTTVKEMSFLDADNPLEHMRQAVASFGEQSALTGNFKQIFECMDSKVAHSIER